MSQLKGQTLQNESAKRQTLQVLQISLVSLEKFKPGRLIEQDA